MGVSIPPVSLPASPFQVTPGQSKAAQSLFYHQNLALFVTVLVLLVLFVMLLQCWWSKTQGHSLTQGHQGWDQHILKEAITCAGWQMCHKVMEWFGRDLKAHLVPNPPPLAGTPSTRPSHCSHHPWTLPGFSGQPLPRPPHSHGQEFLPYVFSICHHLSPSTPSHLHRHTMRQAHASSRGASLLLSHLTGKKRKPLCASEVGVFQLQLMRTLQFLRW